ncbi:LacI family DNA-binding transcriptional regulator [Acuticoccus sp. MNP-M23]|uniref:LacI family DNA-binding transcriptional regulator n=1 Tax=Acuticoccus sp. MNP-M23 TaxID=3072793 RepID=UPI002814A3ED|nr:LacI family DNA-binding transcriptional regulator [Acuticoccus sp. MNP-M23]WMS44572.1 LacI family DNA-binding transcriptional regulator [Acuticoccus sp. MNP-M23]
MAGRTRRAAKPAGAARQGGTAEGGRPGQADIARMLGVSVSTVSRALADSSAINDALKARIVEAATEIGYATKERRPVERLDSITVLCTINSFRDTRSSVYFALLEGIKQESASLAGQIETVMSREGDPVPDAIAETLGPRNGCIFLGIVPGLDTSAALVERGVPVVVCNGIDEDLVVDSISPANHSGGKIMAQQLMALGHRKFLYLSGVNRQTLQRRFVGFRDWVEDGSGVAGAAVDELNLGSDISDHHASAFTEFMKTRGRQVTAVCCYNDGAAVWAVEYLKAMGLSVPQDVSVAGFDDMPIAQIASPPLSTFRIDWEEIGRQTARMLHARMVEPQRAVHFLQVGGNFISRDSTAAPDAARTHGDTAPA